MHERRKLPATNPRPVSASRIASVPPGWVYATRASPESAEGPEMSGKPARGPGSRGTPRRSSGRADLISGKPRRRKATASRPCLPQNTRPRSRRRAGQPRFLGGTRRYLPAHSRAPQPNRTRNPSSRASAGRCRRGAPLHGGRLATRHLREGARVLGHEALERGDLERRREEVALAAVAAELAQALRAATRPRCPRRR